MIDEAEVKRAWGEFIDKTGDASLSEALLRKAFKAGYESGYKQADTESAERDAGASL